MQAMDPPIAFQPLAQRPAAQQSFRLNKINTSDSPTSGLLLLIQMSAQLTIPINLTEILAEISVMC